MSSLAHERVAEGETMTVTSDSDIYYDPFNKEIDKDPHGVWKRMRDEAPLYRNEKHGFWALTRYDDVERGLVDWDTFRSGKGSVLEVILAGMEVPSGLILMEDPPRHDVHRGLMSRVFTPRAMLAIEPKVRAFCSRTLDPLMDGDRFDFISDLGAIMPMLTIGMLLGLPETEITAVRDRIDAQMRVEDDTEVPQTDLGMAGTEVIADYIEWRSHNPSDDLMTKLLTAEFEDELGVVRTLTREEVLTYVMLLAGAGNETTTRLIGWAGKLLAEHPDQRREIAADLSLVPRAIEETLRYEAPSPVQARTMTRSAEYYGETVPEGSIMLLINGSGNRDERHFPDPDRYDIHRTIDHHLSFGYGLHFCLGAALARLEGRVALEEVLQRWPDWEVDWEHAKQAHTPTVRGWERLPVVVAT
jgi:cytochrome P450